MMPSSNPPQSKQDSDVMKMSSDRKVIRPTRRAVSRVVDGQALILDANRDEIRQLNEVGSLIWSMILKSTSTREEILKAIVAQFEVEVEQASVDLDAFLHELGDQALIELSPSPK